MDFAKARRRWDEAAQREEEYVGRRSVNRSLRFREVVRRLDGVRTILDVGAGTGAFSIPLAKRGYDVTHLDLSPGMLAIAREKAAGLPGLKLVEGNAADLSQLGAFDLVLNMDGAISGSLDQAERVVRESCRVARRRLIVSAAHEAFVVADRLKGGHHAEHLRGFTSAELERLIEEQGFLVSRCGGIGSLVTVCGEEYVAGLPDEGFESFLDRCESFDRDVLPDGPGTPNDTGLFAVAERLDGGLLGP